MKVPSFIGQSILKFGVIVIIATIFFYLYTKNQVANPFLQIASSSISDKFTDHKYQYAYAKYFSIMRNKKPKILEIGLGCRMHYGPGASINAWLAFFGKNVEIWVFEIEKDCVLNWTRRVSAGASNVHGYVGDQGNESQLLEFVKTSGGNFDLIIDDGSHRSDHQKTSFRVLFTLALKPGGHYFIEDLFYQFATGIFDKDLGVAYGPQFGGYKSPDNNTVEEITLLIENLLAPWKIWAHLNWEGNTKFSTPSKPIVDKNLVQSVDCFRVMCVITRQSPSDAAHP